MRRLTMATCLLLAASGCHKAATASPPAAATAPEPAARAEAPGDRIVYRFVDHAAEATVTSPSLREAWNTTDYPAKLLDPYSGLRGENMWRVAEVAFADADVASYGTPHPIAPA